MLTRRELSKLFVFGGASLSALGSVLASAEASRWLDADQIISATAYPDIPERLFRVEDFGADADDTTDCSNSISKAIAAASLAGGGVIVFSQGVYRTGPIHLESRIALQIDQGSTLRFSTNPDDYLPPVFTRWEGMELMGYSPLIYGRNLQDVAVRGGGTLDGGADNQTWWPWKGPHSEAHWELVEGEDQKPARTALFDMAERGVAPRERVFADGAFLRPPFIQFYGCERVLIEGVKIVRAPFWLIHPVLCSDVRVRGVHCFSHGPNSDGCDPESCNRVVIEDCLFDTGDDCIALKSGRNNDGRRLNVPCQNVVVQNCHMKEGHGGVVVGSEISGGVANLHVRNCKMDSPHLERAIRIKTNAQRGGLIEHLRYDNIEIGAVKDVFVVNFFYEEGRDGPFLPIVRDVAISNLSVDRANRLFNLRGFEDSPMFDIRLANWLVRSAAEIGPVEQIRDLSLAQVNVAGVDLSLLDLGVGEP